MGIRGHWGLLGGVGGHFGGSRDVGVSGGYWEANRDSRYSEARRGIGASGGIAGILGECRGLFWVSEGIRGVGVSGVYWGLAGTLGTLGLEGV